MLLLKLLIEGKTMKFNQYKPTALSLFVAMSLGMTTYGVFAEDASPEALVLMSEINTDRDGLVRVLASTWASHLGEEENTVLQSFNALSNDKLAKLKSASSVTDVRNILSSKNNKLSRSGRLQKLGVSTEDFVYSPVVPCRVIDTRVVNGVMAANTTRNFKVHGSGAALGFQGGNAAGCTAPRGEPSAVHMNITVVPTGTGGNGTGVLRVFPKDAVEPTASLLNYKLGTVIPNAATVKTCMYCGDDITIRARFNSTHVVADVLGYYYPVDKNDADRMALAYGTFDANGTIRSATENVSSAVWNAGSKQYEITIAGEAYDFGSYAVTVTPSWGSCPDALATVSTIAGDDTLWVKFLDVQGAGSGSYKQCKFQFVMYKNQ